MVNQPIHCHLLTEDWTYFNWYFGDGDSSNLFSPIHYYKVPGRYCITLKVWTDHFCGSANLRGDSIDVLPNGWIYFPNAFTPGTTGNHGWFIDPTDRSNDIFYPHTYMVQTYMLKIYTRWGIEIFRTNRLDVGWNGYYKDVLCPTDVYIYKADGYYQSGMPFSVTGSFLLLK